MASVRLPGGPTLNYREWGRPDGAVVLLLHGLTSASLSWRHVAPELGRRFRVIAPDARGHGGSEWTRDYSIDLMRDDVVRFMEQLGILAAIVVGHSMGALAAYQLAATRPDLIRLLVLEEMPPPDPANPPKPIPRRPEPGADYDWRALIAVYRWRNAPPPSWWELAGQIQAPTLVLGAAHSDLRQSRIEDLSRRIPHATFATMNTNHDGHEARPSEFLIPVEPFISRFAK
ncbi:MAG TPA: alpha/beta hydrolase [Propionibacteriaceae bacterium]|nr:alpha/beta hydrolase [Propionibacteriaceae bacterium]